MIVGALEEIMMDDEFQDLQGAWLSIDLWLPASLTCAVVDEILDSK